MRCTGACLTAPVVSMDFTPAILGRAPLPTPVTGTGMGMGPALATRGRHYPAFTSMRRGLSESAFGSRSRKMPSANCASIFDPSIPWGIANTR